MTTTQETKQKIMDQATRLDSGILLAAETHSIIKTCLELLDKQDKMEELTKQEAKRSRVIEVVREFLIDLHRGKRSLEDQLKAINTAMLFLEGHDYIEQGPKLNQ
jgi:hypothetical protein